MKEVLVRKEKKLVKKRINDDSKTETPICPLSRLYAGLPYSFGFNKNPLSQMLRYKPPFLNSNAYQDR